MPCRGNTVTYEDISMQGFIQNSETSVNTDDVASRWKGSLTIIETIDIIPITDIVFYQETSI